MIKAYSQRLMPPYSGQVQIAESSRARAVTIDGKTWEIQFVRGEGIRRSYRRVAYIRDNEIRQHAQQSAQAEDDTDERILELLDFLVEVSLPFQAEDHYEYWLLDGRDKAPLALIYSCVEESQMETFPERAEWTALPAAVMPITVTEEEQSQSSAPVNYQLERLVAERAGTRPSAIWVRRGEAETGHFPELMLRDDWEEESHHSLYRRYIERQAPRLLMLHGMMQETRQRLEIAARKEALEVERFHALYPEVIDQELMHTIRVEARLRSVSEESPALHKRRDGIYYI